MLVDGKWSTDWQPVQASDSKGGFVRQTSSFRHWVTPDGSPGPTGEGGFAAVYRATDTQLNRDVTITLFCANRNHLAIFLLKI